MIIKQFKFKLVGSTNNVAINLIKHKKLKVGAILAERQNKGRGQRGKKWISYKGNFFASIFFELKKSMPNFKEFSLINPYIVKKTLKEYSTHHVKIKWPNDLLIQDKKVCGILQELIQFEKKFFLIVGIGINTVYSPKVNSFRCTSLLESSGKSIDNSKILKSLKNNYETIFYNYKFNKNLMKQ